VGTRRTVTYTKETSVTAWRESQYTLTLSDVLTTQMIRPEQPPSIAHKLIDVLVNTTICCIYLFILAILNFFEQLSSVVIILVQSINQRCELVITVFTIVRSIITSSIDSIDHEGSNIISIVTTM
jgi:hypothetical protein